MSPTTSLIHGCSNKKEQNANLNSVLINSINRQQESLSTSHVTAVKYESNTLHSLSQTASLFNSINTGGLVLSAPFWTCNL